MMVNKPPSSLPNTVSRSSQSRQTGFTLLELMLAMAIFALLSVAGWQVFDSINRSKERAQPQLDGLTELQYGYGQLQRDMMQVVPYHLSVLATDQRAQPSQVNGAEAETETELQVLNNGFVLSDNVLSFVRYSDPDPRYKQTARLERIAYTFNDGTLVRQRYTNLNAELNLATNGLSFADNSNQANSERPLQSSVIKGVSGGQFEILLPQPTARYPESTAESSAQSATESGVMPPLPKGVAVTFTMMLGSVETPISWVYALNGSPPIVEGPVRDPESGNGNGVGNTEGSEGEGTTGDNDNNSNGNGDNGNSNSNDDRGNSSDREEDLDTDSER